MSSEENDSRYFIHQSGIRVSDKQDPGKMDRLNTATKMRNYINTYIFLFYVVKTVGLTQSESLSKIKCISQLFSREP